MFTPQPSLKESQHITLPLSFIGASLTPPPTNEKAFTQAPRVIALLFFFLKSYTVLAALRALCRVFYFTEIDPRQLPVLLAAMIP